MKSDPRSFTPVRFWKKLTPNARSIGRSVTFYITPEVKAQRKPANWFGSAAASSNA